MYKSCDVTMARAEACKAYSVLASLFETNRLDGVGDAVEWPLAVVLEHLKKTVESLNGGEYEH